MPDAFYGNPMYNTMPTTPPGLEGMRYMLGGFGSMFGMQQRPYVPANQGTFDAAVASGINNPLYKSMLSRVYSQMGSQLGNTAAGMRFVQQMGSVGGFSAAEVQQALASGGAALGGGVIGQFAMPAIDSALSGIGLTGGSIVGAAQAAFNGRMNLMGPGMLASPLDAGQQHQAMGAASAMASLMNGLMSKTDASGNITLEANNAFTQGFDRQRLTQLAMRAAGRGAFSSWMSGGMEGANQITEGGFAERLGSLTDGASLSALDFTAGDFSGGGKDSNLGSKAAKRVREFTREFAHRMQGMTEAMGALRDLTHEVDGLEDKLDALTNGDWMRSGSSAFKTRNALRTVEALTQTYNLDPNETLDRIVRNREAMGGMFGLEAQTEFLTGVEDKIAVNGLSGDPYRANRIRQQAVQIARQNIGSTAGRATQILAYARQNGILSDDQVARFEAALTSGDRGVMDTGLNNLLTTVFGSSEAGRRIMNDGAQMDLIRKSLNSEAETFAMRTMMRGADAEFNARERITAADVRLSATQEALGNAGMRTWQSDDDANRLAQSIAKGIAEAGTGPDGQVSEDARMHSATFLQNVDQLVKQGMSRSAAVSMVASAFKSNSATAQYGEVIDLAQKNQAVANNEYRLTHGGRESQQAYAMAQALQQSGLGGDLSEVYSLLQADKGAEALARIDAISGGLTKEQQHWLSGVKGEASKSYDAAMRSISDKKEVAQLLEDAQKSHFGSAAASEAFSQVANAAVRYMGNKDEEGAYEDFIEQVSKSRFSSIFGKDAMDRVMKAVDSGDTEEVTRLGRLGEAMRNQNAANLRENGYGASLSGYFGSGEYAVNSPRRQAMVKDTIAEAAKRLVLNNNATDEQRNSIAQDLYSFLSGPMKADDLKKLLRMYDPNGEVPDAMGGYISAFSDMNAANDEVDSTRKGFARAMGALRKSGAKGADQARFLQGAIDDGLLDQMGESDLLKEIKSSGLTGSDADAVIAHVQARQKLAKAASAKDKAFVEVTGNDTLVKRIQAAKKRKEEAEKRNSVLLGDSDVKAFMEDTLALDEDALQPRGFFSRLFGSGTGRDAALDSVNRAVGEDEVTKRLGDAASTATARDRMKAKFDLLKEKAGANNPEAVEALKAFKAASNEGATRIKGEITIKNGGEQSPATLEGTMGDRLG